MKRLASAGLQHLIALWFFGCVALASVTWVCFRLGLNVSTAGFVYLIVIVLLSLMDSFVSSAIFSIVSVALLNFFFTEPLFSFEVAHASDVATLTAFVITSFAVTGLVRRLRQIGEEQREQALILDLTHDMVWVRDMNDVIVYWNQAAEKFYGWKRREAIGQLPQNLLHTRFPVPREEIDETLLRTGHWEGELRHTKRDGTEVFVASRWSLQRDVNDRPVRVLSSNTDITERKRSEDALRRSQAAYLAEAQRLSRTGSFGWNVSSGEIFWSEESFCIFGYDPATKPSIDLAMQRVHPDDAALVRNVIDRAAKERQDFDFEHRLLMPDGSVKHLHIVGHVMTDEPDNLQFVGAVMDVTAAKRAEEQLHQAQAELAHASRVTTLGELTASIAHEVNQPLAAIATNGEAGLRFLNRDPPRIDEVRDALRSMIDDSKRASEIVQRIRALTKKADPQMAQLAINTVVNDGISLVRREVANHRVTLRLELAPGLPAVRADRVQLQQVIINLMVNGIQAMAGTDDRQRELVIRSRLDEAGEVLVSVQDSGVGIDPANANRLFDAFFTTKPSGMGMGLSICRTIIEAHGGQLWASRNAGPGATFQFALPPIHEMAC